MNSNYKSKKIGKRIFRFLIFILLFGGLIFGLVFSSWKFSKNIKLGSDFKGYYSALVAVDNLNEKENLEGQPNGNAKNGAKALSQRLNPMGNNQIIVEQAGKNFLKVLSPIDAYQNETVFKNQIQKNGGIVLLNSKSNYDDLQIKKEGENKITRKGINEYFKGAKSTSITNSIKKESAISYKLNGDEFKKLIPKKENKSNNNYEDEQTLSLFILLDGDGLYNDIRNMYNLIKGEPSSRAKSYFNTIIDPIREVYSKNETPNELKQILFDLFYGQWENITSSNVKFKTKGSLMEPKNAPDLQDASSFEKIMNSFTFLSETSKYVYDSNAVTKDFENEGRFSKKIKLWDSSSSLVESKMKVNDLFFNLNKFLIPFIKNNQKKFDEKYFNSIKTNYFLFDGSVAEDKGKGLTPGYIEKDNLITKVDSYTKAEIGASLFNSAGKGFVFTVNSISIIKGTITKVMLWLGVSFLSIITITLFIYMAFFYRILGLFAMIIALAIIGVTLLSITWFNLTVGPETLISSFILLALNIEIFSALFENMKESYFLKKRGLKTSFNISIKENVGLASDLVVALLVPAMCMFWMASNAIRSIAITLAMGSFFTLLFTIIVGVILFKIIINSNLINNNAKLFALNTDFANQGKFLINYKINKNEQKLIKYKSNSNVDQNLISKLEQKNNLLKEKLEKLEQKELVRNQRKEQKGYDILNKKIEKLKLKISKLDPEKKAKKIQKLNFKINEYVFDRDDDSENIIEKDSQIITSNNEKLKIRSVEKNIRHGAKVVCLFGLIALILSTIFGFSFGLRFDNTFGGRTDYTMWGDNIATTYQAITNKNFEEEELKNENIKNLSNKKDQLKREFEEFERNNINDKSAIEFKRTQIVSNYIDFVFSRDVYVNYFLDQLNFVNKYTNHKYSINFGDRYNYKGGAKNWITLTVYLQDPKQSAAVKQLFQTWGISKNENISETSGFITKKIRPSTMLWSLKQIAISVGVILLALLIYILIRFKWTYYISMVVTIVVALIGSVSTILALQIPLGNASIIAIVSGIIFSITSLFIIFSKARSLISSKNEESLINYFKKEIEILYETKLFKKQIKDQLFNMKKEMKKNIKTNKLSQEEIKKLKLEFKEFKHSKKIEYKKIKKENKIKITHVAKKNNYLSEVLVKAFKFGLVRCSLMIVLYALVGALMIVSMPTILSFGLSIIVSSFVTSLFVLFISLPIWVTFEQIRIRNTLARKRFINGLHVSNEEQIIEKIND